jgi:hypothetical protein
MTKLVLAGFCLLTSVVLLAQPPAPPKPPAPAIRWQHDSEIIAGAVTMDATRQKN